MEMVIYKKVSDTEYEVRYHNGCYMGELYVEIDGYFVYMPSKSSGFWEAHVLRNIADKLDELNKEWDESIKNDPVFDVKIEIAE